MYVETDALRWFQQVADGVTVTEVSELESISQSGLSRALARLEADVGTALLRRSGRVLRLTRAGAVFKRHVDAMLHELDDGIAAVGQTIAPDTGTVTVAFQLSLSTWLLPSLVAGFRHEHPEVQFDLRQTRDELDRRVLDRGDIDVELTSLRPTGAEVRWAPLLVEPLHLASPVEDGRAADGSTVEAADAEGPVRLAEFADSAFVTLRRTYLLRQVTERLCEQAGFRPVIAFEGDDLPTVRGLVGAGLGVAVVPAVRGGLAAPADLPLRYRPIADDGAFREIGIAWPAERRLLPAADRFRQYVIGHARLLFPSLTG
jgi:LysR family transcriptional regulator, transcription activator of glutamate synthase operon